MRRILVIEWVALAALAAALRAADPASGPRADGGVVPVGRGSYTRTVPPDMKLPPREIYRTPGVRGPMPTTDWWSSVAWEPFSSNQFPHPLAVQAAKEGLRVSYPGAALRAEPKHVFASFQPDLTLGHSACDDFPDARVDGYGDWSVSVLFARGESSLRVTYGHGSPFIHARIRGGSARIGLEAPARIWAGDASSPTLGLSVRGRHYGLFGPSGSGWRGLEGRELVNDSRGKDHFTLAALPDDRPETLALFARHAHAHVSGTRVEWSYEAKDASVVTRFTFETEPLEGSERDTLFALYPHQWEATDAEILPLAYRSIRGDMRVGRGRAFTTRMRYPGVLPALPGPDRPGRAALERDLEAAAGAGFDRPADTYWHGKVLGSIASLLPVAEELGRDDLAGKLEAELRSRLESWLTASVAAGKAQEYFVHDGLWGALIGQKPSFGSSDALNDHHFHHGYFIRAAAELARRDPPWAAGDAWGGMVELLIRDIASRDRSDPMFPFLRCFDPYAGHSWASGNARFADGNNQESSSEAMNAWTGVILWGEATGDRELRDLGIWLYTTELHAIQEYWFDVGGRTFPEGYRQTCAAIVWGGKTDWATWFSAEPEMVHGINLLPIQSGSLYLGLHPEYVERNLAGLAKARCSDEWKHWHDVLWPYEALRDADRAMARLEAAPEKLDPRARAWARAWIGALQVLGQVDRQVTADHPTAMAFRRDGKAARVAWNLTPAPITVRFSDGAELKVAPRRYAVSR